MGMEYTPKLVPVDVVMNGDYLGSYYLSEVVRIDESRVNIPDLEDLKQTDIDNDENWMTGGYLLGVSPYGKEEGYQFTTDSKVSFVLESPEKMDNAYEDSLDTANSYIEEYIQNTEDAIFGDDFKDKNGVSYKEYLDLDSAAKYFLIQEFTNNGDAYGTPSTKLYKKKDGKLYFGPLWDFDYVAWGSYDYSSEYNTAYGRGVDFTWFERLKCDPEFVKKVKESWDELKPELEKLIKEDGTIDQYEKELSEAAANNFDIP